VGSDGGGGARAVPHPAPASRGEAVRVDSIKSRVESAYDFRAMQVDSIKTRVESAHGYGGYGFRAVQVDNFKPVLKARMVSGLRLMS
jgi:hypothetical protein